MIDHVTDSGWAASAGAWIADMGETGDAARRDVLDPLVRGWLQKLSPKTVLDVGCGEGRLCRMMAGMGMEATGLDPTPALIDHARARDPAGRYIEAMAEAMPTQDAAYDMVLTCLSLIDIADMDAAIAEMARVLAPGGALLAVNLASHVTAVHRKTTDGSAWIWRDGEPVHFGIDDYLKERAFWGEWRGIRIQNHHRPLSRYMSAYLAQGLTLEAFEEPAHPNPDPELRYNRIPYFNLMVWRKPA